MNILFYDTETTGLPNWSEPSDDPAQPHIVQLAAIIADADTRDVKASINLIVKPEGWTIPDETAAIHGIDDELALSVGVPEELAFVTFMRMHEQCGLRVAHNEPFDSRIIRIACHRFMSDEVADWWSDRDVYCTMKESRTIVNAPPTNAMMAAGRKQSKPPKMAEAYEFFTGEPMQNAHNAMADVQACMAVYWHLMDGSGQASLSV